MENLTQSTVVGASDYQRDLAVNFSKSESENISYSFLSMDIYTHFMLCGCIALFGTVSNTFNMTIFIKLGVKDSMSVGLIALSFSDFLISFLSITGISYFIWDAHFMDERNIIDAQTIEHVSIGWLRDMLFLCSGWITTVLSIERCVCVVFPFKVKQMFTKSRAVSSIVVIYVIHVAIYLPIFLSHRLVRTKVQVPSHNGTALGRDRLVVVYSSNRPQIQLVNDIFTGAISPIPAQTLVLISVIWMIYGLRMSSKVRYRNSTSENVDGKQQSQLSNKEIRLIRVVLTLAIILTLCNTPRFLAVYAKQIFPEISFGKDGGNLYMFLWNMSALGTILNSSVNVFVYLAINTNYRDTLRQMFKILP